MAVLGKLTTFARCAAALGRTPREQLGIFWRLTKNLRARLHLARHSPGDVYALDTSLGRAWLRDNIGDITNLWGLWVNDVYRVRELRDAQIAGGAVIDAGANIGLFAAWASKHLPGAPIHCFEPLQSNLPLIARNCPQAHINAVALGSTRQRLAMRVDLHDSIASRIETPWKASEQQFDVIPLDEYVEAHGIADVALLKIDVEGMETDVLDGAAHTLRLTRHVVVETHGPERHAAVADRLHAAGFDVDDVRREGATGMVHARRTREARRRQPAASRPQPARAPGQVTARSPV